MPAQRTPENLAREMARPVVQGKLPIRHAYAALLAMALRRAREGDAGDPLEAARAAARSLNDHVTYARTRQRDAISAVRRRVVAMSNDNAPSNAIRAEAHTVAADGYPGVLDEPDVDAVVADELAAILDQWRRDERYQNGAARRPRRKRG